MTQRLYRVGLLTFFAGALAMAQDPSAAWFQSPPANPYTPMHPSQHPSPDDLARQAEEQMAHKFQEYDKDAKLRALKDGYFLKMTPPPKGRWWSDTQTAEMLGLTTDQVKKMDDIFQQHRLKLIDLNASLEKEELILEPLMGADQPDDNRVVAQIDKVAQARAQLEMANSRMLWSIRRVLTPDQWKKLQSQPLRPLKPKITK